MVKLAAPSEETPPHSTHSTQCLGGGGGILGARTSRHPAPANVQGVYYLFHWSESSDVEVALKFMRRSFRMSDVNSVRLSACCHLPFPVCWSPLPY